MDSLNFENFFEEEIAKEIIMMGKYVYRRDMIRIARYELEEERKEIKTYLYEEPKKYIVINDGELYAYDEIEKKEKLKQIENGVFNYHKLFDMKENFAILIDAKEFYKTIMRYSRILESEKRSKYQNSLTFDFKNNKICLENEEKKVDRESVLKILQKRATIEEELYSVPLAVVEDYMRSVITFTEHIRINFIKDSKGKKLIRLINPKKMELILTAK